MMLQRGERFVQLLLTVLLLLACLCLLDGTERMSEVLARQIAESALSTSDVRVAREKWDSTQSDDSQSNGRSTRSNGPAAGQRFSPDFEKPSNAPVITLHPPNGPPCL